MLCHLTDDSYRVFFFFHFLIITVADPGFPRDGGKKLLFGKKFPENFMKIKEIGPGEGRIPSVLPLEPTNELTYYT